MISILGAVMASLAAASPALATPPELVTTNVMVPFEVVSQGATEKIAANGTLHVVTDVLIGADSTSLKVHSNFLDTMGIGLSSGRSFRISGSQTMSFDLQTADINTVVFIALMQASASAQEDLKEIMQALVKLRFSSIGRFVGVSVEPFRPCD